LQAIILALQFESPHTTSNVSRTGWQSALLTALVFAFCFLLLVIALLATLAAFATPENHRIRDFLATWTLFSALLCVFVAAKPRGEAILTTVNFPAQAMQMQRHSFPAFRRSVSQALVFSNKKWPQKEGICCDGP
jgi:pheromone shutdown protein TraB